MDEEHYRPKASTIFAVNLDSIARRRGLLDPPPVASRWFGWVFSLHAGQSTPRCGYLPPALAGSNGRNTLNAGKYRKRECEHSESSCNLMSPKKSTHIVN